MSELVASGMEWQAKRRLEEEAEHARALALGEQVVHSTATDRSAERLTEEANKTRADAPGESLDPEEAEARRKAAIAAVRLTRSDATTSAHVPP